MIAAQVLRSGASACPTVARNSNSRRSTCVSVRCQKLGADVPNINKGRKLDSRGYMDVDGSGKGNVFPTQPKAFLRSQRAEKAANTGLGGLQGVIVLAAALGVVALSSIPVLQAQTGETLNKVADNYSGDSLSAIAERIQSSI